MCLEIVFVFPNLLLLESREQQVGDELEEDQDFTLAFLSTFHLYVAVSEFIDKLWFQDQFSKNSIKNQQPRRKGNKQSS